MQFSSLGAYTPVPVSAGTPIRVIDTRTESPSAADAVCPFSPYARDETWLGKEIHGAAPNHHPKIGHYTGIHVGAAVQGRFRAAGSSGGMTNWLLSRLIETGEIDAAVGVGEAHDNNGGPLFEYQLATTADAVKRFAKSKYYPVQLSQVIQAIRERPGRYAIVGVPCFAKAIRNLCEQDPLLKERISYVFAIVCGHMKTSGFAESLAWQVGVAPEQLRHIDFRVKVPGASANRYAIEARGETGSGLAGSSQVFDMQGTDWGLGYFKLKACDYCDDIAGETADITLGDAWLSPEIKDWRGNNIMVVRHPRIARLLAQANAEGDIAIRDVSASDFIHSQAANYRHRHDGLAYRLWLQDQQNRWRPSKRIQADGASLPPRRQQLMKLRAALAEKSQAAFLTAKNAGSMRGFTLEMAPLVLRYQFKNSSLIKYCVKETLIFLRKFRRKSTFSSPTLEQTPADTAAAGVASAPWRKNEGN
jgi:coenzyme F420-reducing hydrogenase beta subunit